MIIYIDKHNLYANVTVDRYFSGTQTIKCTWKYKYYYNDTWKTTSETWTVTCIENPVSIHPSQMTLSVGEKAYLTYSHKFDNNYTKYADIDWGFQYPNANDGNIIKLGYDGSVEACNPGEIVVRVYSSLCASNDPTGKTCTITVLEPVPTNVSLPDNMEILVGESKTLTPEVIPSDIVTNFSWKSDDTNIAKVNSDGIVTGVNPGNTKIWVTTEKGGCTSCCTVTVSAPPVLPKSISLPDNLSMFKGFTHILHPTILPEDAESTCTWNSSDNSIVQVDSKGEITAISEGRAVITVSIQNGLKASCEVTVNDLPAGLDKKAMESKLAVIKNLKDATFKIL